MTAPAPCFSTSSRALAMSAMALPLEYPALSSVEFRPRAHVALGPQSD